MAENLVTIFGDANFGGASKQLAEGNYDMNDLGIGNDQLSSLKVPSGLKVTLFEHGGYAGSSKVFISDAGWVGDDFNDKASSIKVERVAPAPSKTAAPNVVLFDGKTTYGSAQINVSESAYTVSVWFKTTNGNCGIFSVDAGDRGVQGYDRNLWLKDGNLCARLWSNETIWTAKTNFADGKWHKVTHVFGGAIGGQRIYVDGILEAKGTKVISDFQAQDGINVGYTNDAQNPYFEGEISEVSVWNIARAEREIILKNEVLYGNEKGLQGYWNFKDVKSITTSTVENTKMNSGFMKMNIPRIVITTSFFIADRTANAATLALQGTVVWQASVDYSGVFLPVVRKETVTAIRNTGAQMAQAVKPISAAWKNITADTDTPVPLSQIAATMPQVSTSNTLSAAIANGKLTLSRESLGSYGQAASGISNIFSAISAFVNIDKPTIGLVKITPGESGDVNAVAFTKDVLQEQGLATVQTVALRVGGAATLTGPLMGRTVRLQYAEFAQLTGEPYAVVKFVFDQPVGIGSFATNVPILGNMSLSNAALIISSTDSVKDKPFNTGLSRGFNFFGQFLLADSVTPGFNPFRFIGNFFGIRTIDLHGVISPSAIAPLYLVEAAINIEKYIVNTNNFKLRFSKVAMGMEVKGVPLEPAMFVSAETIVTLKVKGQETNLVFIGGMKVEPESVTASFTMLAENDKPYTSLGGTVVSKGVWDKPFGIPGISIRELALQTGLTYELPFVDNIGVHGNLKLGSIDGSISVLVDINDPDQFILAGATDRITIIEIMSCMSPLTFAAYQAAPAEGKKLLNKFVRLYLENVKINIVPVAASIGAIDFEQGVTIMGALNVWGWHASMSLNVDLNTGLDMKAEMDAINILNVFTVTGAGSDPLPMMKLKISPSAVPEMAISSKVTLLGMTQELLIKGGDKGFIFHLERSVANVLNATLDCGFADGNMFADGSFVFKLNTTISTPLGSFSLRADMSAEGHIRLGKDGFNLRVKGSFSFQGATITVPEFALNVAPSDVTGLLNSVVKYISDNAKQLFTNLFADLQKWANAVKSGVVKYAGDVASVAKDVYKATENELATVYQTLGTTAEIIAKELYKGYGYTMSQTNTILSMLHIEGNAAKDAMKKAGYIADQVDNFFKDPFGIGSALTSYFSTFGQDKGQWTQDVRDKVSDMVNAINNGSYYNVMVCKSDQANASGLRGVVYDGKASFSNINNPIPVEFKIYAFTDGSFTNTGDGGFGNWAFKGFYDRPGGGKTVNFRQP